MTLKLTSALLASFTSLSLFAAADPADKALDTALQSNRAAAEARSADPSASSTTGNKKVDAKKVAAQQKADLAEYKGMVKDNLASIKAMFTAAEQAWKAKNYKQAGAFYQSVAQATAPGSEEMVETSNLRINSEMENLAKDHIRAADDAGIVRDFMKQIDELSIVVKDFGITRQREDATRKLTSLKTRPEVSGFVDYAQAEQLLADNKLTEAFNALNAIANNPRYEHSIPALKASRKIDELNKNEETRSRLKAEFVAKADKDAPQLLNAAKNYAVNDMPKKAKEKLETVIDRYPGTPYADEAKKQLDQLPSPNPSK